MRNVLEQCTVSLTYQVEYLNAVDEVVYFAHEALHEDHLGQTDAHDAELCREGVKVVEVMKLHGG